MRFFLHPEHFRWLDHLPAPRMPRWRKRGVHHADAIRIDLFTATVPVKQTPDRPPWMITTSANPVLPTDAEVAIARGLWGTIPEQQAAKAERLPQVIA